MLGEVGLRRSRCAAGSHMPDDGDGGEHESKETESRDGKEEMHACLRQDNKVHGLRAAYSIWLELLQRGGMNLVRLRMGTGFST
jgi:hypothetical protein